MSLTVQFQTMIAMIFVGGWLGAALDTYHRFLKRQKTRKWIVFMSDCMFWILQGLIIFYTLLFVNEGEVRFYIFLALLCGFAAYQALLHEFYIKILDRVIFTTIKVNQFFVRLITFMFIRPVKLLIQGLTVMILFILHRLWLLLLFLFKLLITPFKWLGVLAWKVTPIKIKKYFVKVEGFWRKIKNILIKWWKRFRS